MLYLLGIPAVAAYGYYYYRNNKKKIGNKIIDLYATLAVMTKETLKKTINNDFLLLNCFIMYNENNFYKKINVTNYFFENSKIMKENGITKETYNDIIEEYKIKLDDYKDLRLLFTYKFDNIIYYKYSSFEKFLKIKNNNKEIILKDFYPFYNKNIEKDFIDNKIMDIFTDKSVDNKSFYILLNSELKDIETVTEIENFDLKFIFDKLKGPFNDYGFLTNNLIKNKWIYEDFEINKSENINIKQGLYLDEEDYELKSDEINIEYNDEYVILPSLLKLFKEKINLEGLICDL